MKENKQVWQMLALITQVGIGMLAPIFLCVWLGQFLDARFSINSSLIFLLLGILAGCRNTYKLLSGLVKEEKDPQNDSGASKKE